MIEYKSSIDRKFATAVADKLVYKVPAGAKFTGFKPLVNQQPSLASGTFYQLNVATTDKIGNYFIEEMTVVVPVTVTIPIGYTVGQTMNVRQYLTGFGGPRADPINKASSNISININGTPFNYVPTNITNALMSLNYGARNSDIEGLCPTQLDETCNYGYLNAFKASTAGGSTFDDGKILQETIQTTINNPFAGVQSKTFGNQPRQLADADFVFTDDSQGVTPSRNQDPVLVASNVNVVSGLYYLKYKFRTPFWTPICAYYQSLEKVWSNVYLLEFQRTFAANATQLMFNYNSVPSSQMTVIAAAAAGSAPPIQIVAGNAYLQQPSILYVNTYTLPDCIALNPITQLTWYRYTNRCNNSFVLQGGPGITPAVTAPLIGKVPSVLVSVTPTQSVIMPSLQIGTVPKAIYIWGQLVDDGSKLVSDPDALGFYFTGISLDLNTNQGIFSQMTQRQIYDEFSAKKNFSKSFLETQFVTTLFNYEGTSVDVATGIYASGVNAVCNMPLYGQVLRIDTDQLPIDWDKESCGTIKPIQLTIKLQVGACDNTYNGITHGSFGQIYCWVEEESYMIIDQDKQVKQLAAPIDEQIVMASRKEMPAQISYIHPLLQGGSFFGDLWDGVKKVGKYGWDHRDTIGQVAKLAGVGKHRRHSRRRHSYRGRGYDDVSSDSEPEMNQHASESEEEDVVPSVHYGRETRSRRY